MITITLPIKTVAGLNAREHHMARMRRVKNERCSAKWGVWQASKNVALPVVVTMTRLSSGELDDDNLQGACKAIRDGIADAYGIDDRDRRIKWQYAQAKCKRGEFGVIVRIEALTPETITGKV
jgi:hypothetical protein